MSLKIYTVNVNRDLNLIKSNTIDTTPKLQHYLQLTLKELQNNKQWGNDITNKESYSFMSMCNYQRKNDMSVIFMYITIRKTAYGHQVTATNWLDCLHLSEAMFDDAHILMNKIRKTNDLMANNNGLWKKVSKAGLLKAFNPLIYFIPKPLRARINSYSLYNVSSAISSESETYSKDYIRNFFNKVVTNLKSDFAILNCHKTKSSIVDKIIHDNDEIGGCLLHTELIKPINIIQMETNMFLESLFAIHEKINNNRL